MAADQCRHTEAERRSHHHRIPGSAAQRLDGKREQVHPRRQKSAGNMPMLALVFCFVAAPDPLCAHRTASRTKMRKRKWLWIISSSLIGIGKVTMNWSTGKLSLIQETVNATGGHSYNFDFLSFQLFGASAFAQPYGPWILSVSLPFGAILFLLKRKSLAGGTPPPFKRQLRMGSDPI